MSARMRRRPRSPPAVALRIPGAEAWSRTIRAFTPATDILRRSGDERGKAARSFLQRRSSGLRDAQDGPARVDYRRGSSRVAETSPASVRRPGEDFLHCLEIRRHLHLRRHSRHGRIKGLSRTSTSSRCVGGARWRQISTGLRDMEVSGTGELSRSRRRKGVSARRQAASSCASLACQEVDRFRVAATAPGTPRTTTFSP